VRQENAVIRLLLSQLKQQQMTLDITREEAQAFLNSLKDFDFVNSDTTESTLLITLAAKMKTVQ
jgi:hypothetical protein